MGEAIVRSFGGPAVSFVNLLKIPCRARERASRARRCNAMDIAAMVTFLASDDARMCSGGTSWAMAADVTTRPTSERLPPGRRPHVDP